MRILLDSKIYEITTDHVLSSNLQDLLDVLKEIEAEISTRSLSLKDLERTEFVIDFLVTEDRDLHKDASAKDMDDRVLLVEEALQIFSSYINKDPKIVPLPLKREFVRNLNYDDRIFDTLKEEYKPGFEVWFKRISKEGRKSWVYYRKDGTIGAILIYKLETESIDDSKPPLPERKRLKVAMLKVTYIEHKIGELFIKMAVDVSVKNKIDEIYLTHFTKANDPLVKLISEYGFNKIAIKNNGEDIFAKRLIIKGDEATRLSPIEISKIFYPSFYDGALVKKFVVPILPEYHNKLFTDFSRRQITLPEYADEFVVEGNTIKKAYLSHSNIKRMERGDLILFYRSEDEQAITSIGVVETVHTGVKDAEQILQLVGKRTVFSREEIDKWVEKSPVSVFLFRHHFHLMRPVGLEELIDGQVIKAAPQSVMEINTEKYAQIKKMGGIDERYTVH
ncbi:MAG: EVE domain protein [Euryarchaeota archaeon ADurb.Bin190]|jgi:predicted RNA-binding protein with PUA-like domain|uniref:EVE domain-containing protein n=1 Tax=Methanothrix sp. TaxID=90426 RepID=UPI0009CD3A56|nr:MAG: EVE domain protein [Euryarchaeota archaeon ADurb.Bin190]